MLTVPDLPGDLFSNILSYLTASDLWCFGAVLSQI